MKQKSSISIKIYQQTIKNSIGSKFFRHSFLKVNGKKTDILKNGLLACAFYVSSVIIRFGLIKKIHATVDGTVKDMKQSGWEKIKKPRVGSILIWEAIKFPDGEIHRHIGFYLGRKRAASNNAKLKTPSIHHWTFGRKNGKPARKIKAIYWNKRLIPSAQKIIRS